MNQRGQTLLVVLLLVLLCGAVSALALSGALLRLTAGRSETARSQTALRAEGNVNWQLRHWDPFIAETLAVGRSTQLPGTLLIPGMSMFDSLERLGQGLYLVGTTTELRSRAGVLEARERVGQLVVRTAPSLRDDAGISGGGAISIAVTAVADGSDMAVVTWGSLCPPPTPPARAVTLGPATWLDPAGCGGPPCISGSPPTGLDSTLTSGWIQQLGAVPLDSLIAHADQRLNGLVVGPGPVVGANGSCDRAAPANLGDPAGPAHPCGSYLPITAAAPGTQLHDGVGQGLLIGQGGLTLSGSFHFTGVVLALGPLVLRDQATLVGSVGAADSVTLGGTSSVQRSTCAVRRASTGAARPFFPVNRPWFRSP